MWLLPTKDRIENVARFFRSCLEYGCTTPGMVLVNADEWAERSAEYGRLILPAGWSFRPVEATCLAEAVGAVLPELIDGPWVGLLTDDLVPAFPGWDSALVGSLQGWNFVSSNDGWQAPARMHGATVWSGPLLRAVGWLFPPGFRHLFMDNVWESIAAECGCWQTRMDIMVKHMHAGITGAHDATEAHVNASWANDEAAWLEWERTDRASTCASVRAVMLAHGVSRIEPDFTGLHIMIGVPSVSGSYESVFMASLFATLRFLAEKGVGVEMLEEKYNADITMARSKLFTAFLRSPRATHLLMIDADMGWDTGAVSRLIGAKKDLVCVAGPKKFYPLKFAANHTDEAGRPLPIVFDRASGTVEVSEVGMAFALLSREAATKIAAGFPELTYRNLMGEPEYAPFIPMIAHGRYFAEDFAFCARWRALGGTVHICPDVKLKHVGHHTFEGAISSMWDEMAKAAQERLAAE